MKLRVILAFLTLILWCNMHAQMAKTDSIRLVSEEMSLSTQQFISSPDSSELFFVTNTIQARQTPEVWLPDAQKSLWYALIFPGAGQIYNRSYWKLPIVYGGAAALVYGITWNNQYYQQYSQAYRDIMDSDPNTKSYEYLLPKNVDPNSSYARDLMKKKHNSYRRYRDLCIVGAVAFYAITIIDAYVDAQLSDFDINPDLSMRVRPRLMVTENTQKPSVGVGVGFNF